MAPRPRLAPSLTPAMRPHAFSTSARAAAPGMFPVQSGPSPSSNPPRALAKPPTSLWYTSRPSLNAAITSLASSLNLSKSHLFRSGLIPSVSAPLQGPGAEFGALSEFQHPRVRRWMNTTQMATYLRNGTDLRSSQYKRLTSLLGSLEGLLPYAALADRLPMRSGMRIPTLVGDPVGVANAGMRTGNQAEVSLGTGGGLQAQLESLLSRFQQPKTFSATGEQVERLSGKDRRMGKMDAMGRIAAVGRRKESSARVWIIPTLPAASEEDAVPGRVVINAVSLPVYFSLPAHRASVVEPLSLTSTLGSFNVFAIAKGGGLAAQSEAVAMGVARALAEWEQIEVDAGRLEETAWRALLKKRTYRLFVRVMLTSTPDDLLERDPRMVERKKTGQPKARKLNAWVRR